MKRKLSILSIGVLIITSVFMVLLIYAVIHQRSINLKYINEAQSYKSKINELQNNLDVLESTNDELIENVSNLNIALLEKDELVKELKLAQDYPLMKNVVYQGSSDSGLRVYTGTKGIYLYPVRDSEIVLDITEMQENTIVNCIGVVTASNNESWGIVISNNNGNIKIGYIPLEDLIRYNDTNKSSIESIGDFHLGDRIESMIGTIDRDYYVLSDNLCIYEFPKYIYETVDEDTFSDNDYIDALVRNDFHIFSLRTDSPDYRLKSGYGVGDNADEVIEYYSRLYKIQVNDEYQLTRIIISISESEQLIMLLDTAGLADNSIVKQIELMEKD